MQPIALRAIWWLSAGSAGVLVGLASAAVQTSGVAPIGVTSLVTGVALGVVLVGLGWRGWVGNRKTPVAATVLCALLTVFSQHVGHYRHYQRQWHQVRQDHPAVAMFREESGPKSLLAYLKVETTAGRVALWTFDAALVAAAALATVAVSNRGCQPGTTAASHSSKYAPPANES